MSDIPLMNPEWSSDERTEGVVLLDSGECWKQTAKDYGDYWMVVDWETHVVLGQTFWLDRCSYSVTKEVVAKLAEMGATT